MKQADKLQLPPWTDVVKTAHWKELSPYNPDWYYVRAASVARQIYLKQGLGVGKLRKIYGTCARLMRDEHAPDVMLLCSHALCAE